MLTQFNFQLSFTIQYEIVPQEHETEKKKIQFSPNAINKGSSSAKKKSNRDNIELELEDGEFMDFNPSAVVLDELLESGKKMFFPLQNHQKKLWSKILLVRSNLVKNRGKINVLRQQTT